MKWKFTEQADLLAIYSNDQPLELRTYRPK